MGKTLLSLRQRNDFNGKQIRCILIENPETGRYQKVKEVERFEQVLKEIPASLRTLIYDPTEEDRTRLLRLIATNTKNVEGEMVSEIGEEDILLTLLQLTDLDLNPEQLTTNRQLMKEILAQPSNLFLSLKNELELILLEIVMAFEETAALYQKMPSEMLDATNQLLELRKEEASNKQRIKDKQKEIHFLKKRLEELEGNQDENL